VTDAAVEVHDLTIDHGDVRAVDGASFVARRGEVTVLLGPNGAGKTSTVEHLEGFRPASGGRASVLGLDPVRDHRHLVRRVGIMLQSGGIQPAIRPRELLGQYAGFFPDPLDVDGLLRRSGLWERQRTPFRRLSGGEQQRLSLALALIGRPEVLLLDEPTAGVDLEGREQIRSTLDELRDQGATVLLTTHDLDEAERVADRLVLLHRGSVVAAGSTCRPSATTSAPPSGPVAGTRTRSRELRRRRWWPRSRRGSQTGTLSPTRSAPTAADSRTCTAV
jgi:ABC-2 type transport system ATP-binding protein